MWWKRPTVKSENKLVYTFSPVEISFRNLHCVWAKVLFGFENGYFWLSHYDCNSKKNFNWKNLYLRTLLFSFRWDLLLKQIKVMVFKEKIYNLFLKVIYLIAESDHLIFHKKVFVLQNQIHSTLQFFYKSHIFM